MIKIKTVFFLLISGWNESWTCSWLEYCWCHWCGKRPTPPSCLFMTHTADAAERTERVRSFNNSCGPRWGSERVCLKQIDRGSRHKHLSLSVRMKTQRSSGHTDPDDGWQDFRSNKHSFLYYCKRERGWAIEKQFKQILQPSNFLDICVYVCVLV